MSQIRIEHDDRPEDIIEKVNEALDAHGLRIVDDDQLHDGYCLFQIVETRGRPCGKPHPSQAGYSCELNAGHGGLHLTNSSVSGGWCW